MPWRLILFVIIFAVLLVFISFNLDDSSRCDINFGFGAVIRNVPVFLTIFTSFILGLFCAFPLLLRSKKPKKEKPVNESKPLEIKSKYFKRNEKNSDSGAYEKI
jgi:uncharacterized integral membrane protein